MGAFISLVWEKGTEFARPDLPWRYCDDPYAVYISEVMLQQTQVSRVLKYWEAWMKQFPTLDALASASNSDVLEQWQGLGYNRRALALKRSADICAARLGGKLPDTLEGLDALPGVGPATAAGVYVFAYQKPAVYIETNVRSVFIHHFFSIGEDKVSDKEIIPLVKQSCSLDDPRAWYYALLDYGAHLKQGMQNPSRKSKSYTRQSAFEGSIRQKRSFILKEVLSSPGITSNEVYELLCNKEKRAGRNSISYEEFKTLLDQLIYEGFFTDENNMLTP